MSNSDDTIQTAYGILDRATFTEVQANYDTTSLLCMVGELDRVLAEARGEDGLRDMLLRLHAMAHTVINGAGMSAPTENDSLPELAADTMAEMQKVVRLLQGWLRQIEPLERLAPRH